MSMKQVVKRRVWSTLKAVGLTAIIVFTLSGVVSAQDVNPEVVVSAPQELVRLSWGAVFAGSVIALIMQLALNLLGISIGMMSINPDAHSTDELDLTRWGVLMARKGGVSKERVLNCLDLKAFAAHLEQRKRTAARRSRPR